MAEELAWQAYHEAVEHCLAAYSVMQLRAVVRSLARRILPQDRAAFVEYLTVFLDKEDAGILDNEDEIGPGFE